MSETITVSGEAPTVDVQGSVRSVTVSDELIADIPVPKLYTNMMNLVPGTRMGLGNTQDVGGSSGPLVITFTTHGGRTNEGRYELNGLSPGAAINGGGTNYYVMDIGNAQEVQFNTSGGLAEGVTAAAVMNVVPKSGGNKLRGSMFVNGAVSWMSSSNYTAKLQSQGLRAPNSLLNIWDINGVVGGPIKQDKVWFFGGARYQGNDKLVSNMWQNANCTFAACNPSIFTYTPNFDEQARGDGRWHSTHARVTWQVSPRNKLQFFADYQPFCVNCVGEQPGGLAAGAGPGTSPEAANRGDARPMWVEQGSWSAPVSNRLLLEAGWMGFHLLWGGAEPSPNATRELVRITELCAPACRNNGNIGPVTYRSVNWANNQMDTERWQASATYVTGSQSMKFGYQGEWLSSFTENHTNDQNLAFTFNNGVPIQLTEFAFPYRTGGSVLQHSVYAQDSWTRNRLTVSGGLRYDHATSGWPEQQVGPNTFVPAPVVFAAGEGVTGYNDITPRGAVVLDVFGTGKTALKFTVGKYLEAAQYSVAYSGPNPLNLLPSSVTRTWTNRSGTFNPWNDCDLLNPLANGSCGTINNLAFGTKNLSAAYDPTILSGWGVRPNDWMLGLSVQQQIASRTSIEAGYFRRSFYNFLVLNNQALDVPGAATPFSVMAPSDPRLPGGGGYPVSGLFNVVPTLVGQTDSLVTYANRIAGDGSMFAYSNSIDLQLTMRNYHGLTVQGGFSTIQSILDSCRIKAELPLGSAGAQTVTSNAVSANPWCHSASGFLTDYRVITSYALPWGGVQLAATFQSNPGAGSSPTFIGSTFGQPGLQANVVYTSAQVAPSLGRPLAGVNTVTVNVLEPGTLYGDRINQLDLRASKTLRFGGQRLLLGLDVYNAMNVNPVTGYNQTWGTTWLSPTSILAARFAKVTAQFDF